MGSSAAYKDMVVTRSTQAALRKVRREEQYTLHVLQQVHGRVCVCMLACVFPCVRLRVCVCVLFCDDDDTDEDDTGSLSSSSFTSWGGRGGGLDLDYFTVGGRRALVLLTVLLLLLYIISPTTNPPPTPMCLCVQVGNEEEQGGDEEEPQHTFVQVCHCYCVAAATPIYLSARQPTHPLQCVCVCRRVKGRIVMGSMIRLCR